MPSMLAYFGPETVLPATSIIATIVGVVLMLGKNSIRWCVGLLLSALRRKPKAEAPASAPAPHFARAAKARAAEKLRR
jgi:hypothetical protein